ncbi:MAG: hypothetical protein IPP34_22115 [Bacteroidetes bacterium]|nr:hypothetical protein [Bacteroidota bacterium]
MSNPDKFAWDLFIQLSQASSENPKLTIWETWALAADVFVDPNVAPTWKPTTVKDIDNFETLPLQQFAHLGLDPKILFDPNSPTRNETRMNRVAFDFIVSNDLYNAQGLESVYASYPNKKIDLPVEAKEIKAIWATIETKDTARYHFALGKDGKTYYGLKGIHIITKDIPNWFWSTFEHMDNFEESEEFKKDKELLASKDSYGYDVNDMISDNLKNDLINHYCPTKIVKK